MLNKKSTIQHTKFAIWKHNQMLTLSLFMISLPNMEMVVHSSRFTFMKNNFNWLGVCERLFPFFRMFFSLSISHYSHCQAKIAAIRIQLQYVLVNGSDFNFVAYIFEIESIFYRVFLHLLQFIFNDCQCHFHMQLCECCSLEYTYIKPIRAIVFQLHCHIAHCSAAQLWTEHTLNRTRLRI